MLNFMFMFFGLLKRTVSATVKFFIFITFSAAVAETLT